MFNDYTKYDAIGLAELIRGKQVSPGEVLEAAIARVERINPKINAVVGDLYDHARLAIEAGLPDGPFKGVPFLLKDLYALCDGALTTQGSRFFSDNVADHDTEMVARYKRAGMAIFGKTSTPEFGLTITTEPRLFGPTRNPWNRDYMAGGSSGGAAAAVAAGMVPVAHASDGGGSIRIPASCCGVFGMKPTRARNPQGPDRGEGWSGMSTEHVVTRSVRDSAALLDATCGPDVGAPYYAAAPARPFLDEVKDPRGKLRVGFARTTAHAEPIDPECARAADSAAKLVADLGHTVEEAAFDFVPEEFGAAFRVIIAGNIRTAIELYAAKVGRQPTAEDFERITWMFFESGAKASAADYARAVVTVHRTGRQIARFFERYDVLLTPTLAGEPQKIGVFDMNTSDPDRYGRAIARYTAFTAPFNASGNPAMSVPLHWTPAGLPIGVQFAGRYGDEATLFRLAAQLEQARPWFDRRPDLDRIAVR